MKCLASYLCLILPALAVLASCDQADPVTVYDTVAPAAYDFPNTPARQDTARGMIWEVPARWVIAEDVGDQLLADYRLPGKTQALPGRATVSNITGDGGGLEENLQRWRRQLYAFEVTGAVPGEVVTEPNLIAPGMFAVKIYIPGQNLGDYAPSATLVTMITLVNNEQQPITTWFFKLTGDAETVAEAEPTFNQMVSTFRVDPEIMRALRESEGAGQ